jgi:hypothetical protein
VADEGTLEERLRACRRSALHLEMRDGYMLDDPMLQAWRAGHRDDPADRDTWWRPWLELMCQTTARGVDVRRARLVSEPISEYIRYEYDITFMNVAAGELVRWLPRRQATDVALPGNDFWLFDDDLVLVNHFSGDGDWLDIETSTNPSLAKLLPVSVSRAPRPKITTDPSLRTARQRILAGSTRQMAEVTRSRWPLTPAADRGVGEAERSPVVSCRPEAVAPYE